MSGELEALSELTRRLGGRRDEGGVLVLRHSVREPILRAEVSAAIGAPLTDEGRALARSLGERLPAGMKLRLYWSPVPRCQETAERIAEGASASEVELRGPRDYLGALYVLEPEGFTRHFARLGQAGFLAAWLRNELPPAVVKPLAQAGRLLLSLLLAEHRVEDRALDLHVTHDLTLITLLGLVRDVGAADFRWPGYLEGLLLEPRGEELEWDCGASRHRSRLDGSPCGA